MTRGRNPDSPGEPAGDPAPRPPVGEAVRSFYDALPFNHWSTVEAAKGAILENPIRHVYPDLHRLLGRRDVHRVVEFGCGTGWLACSLARHYGASITAVDFSATALQRAAALARELGVADCVTFLRRDLFDDLPAGGCDLVVSLGVLHHTGAARRAFGHILRAARTGGYVHLGLYHEPGRRVFLDLFAGLLAGQGETAAFERFAELAGTRGSDPEHLRSWFRDQVLHPHETQHTLREVAGWLDEEGLTLCSTSINRFQAFGDRDRLFALEAGYAALSHQANVVEGRLFPGFFTVLAQRSRL